jgi:phosphoribosylformylglycinamidine cyclo-ligase
MQRIGDVATREMDKVFNMGAGMIIAVAPADAAAAIESLGASGHAPWQLGELVPGTGEVTYV